MSDIVLSLNVNIDDDGLLLTTEGGMKIMSLDMSHWRLITDDGLSHIQKLPSLTNLNLFNCNITDDSLSYIQELTSLEYMDLSRCDLTTFDGIFYIEELSSIIKLFI